MRQIHAPGRREAQAKKKLEADERNARPRPVGGRGLGRDATFRGSTNRGGTLGASTKRDGLFGASTKGDGPFGAPSRELPDAMENMRKRRTLIAVNSNDDSDTDNDDWSDEDGGAVSSLRLWHL